MAGISVESQGGGGRKSVNAELMLVPMIDLLMVTVAFLLVTAVWSQMARLESNAKVPGRNEEAPDPADAPPRRLHVRAKDDRHYELAWQSGKQVERTIIVEAQPSATKGTQQLPALAAAIASEWSSEGQHRAPADLAFDEAVVHTENDVPYSRLMAILDAVKQPVRDVSVAGRAHEASAFSVTFAVD